MKIWLAVALLLLTRLAVASPDAPPRGEWHHADLRGMEILAGGTCVRLWFEERTYSLVPAGDSRLTGTYVNVIRAAPVGLSSFSSQCKFPAPAENPVASQFRLWAVVGKRVTENTWRVRAEPGAPSGDLRVDKTEEFETRLELQGENLVDSLDGEGPDQALLFRHPAPSSPSPRVALEETIRRMLGGACLEVLSQLDTLPDAAREMCALRLRMNQLSGRLLSLSVDDFTELDRLPAEFPKASSSGYRRQRAFFFSFTGRYENQQIPGNAIVVEEEGTWHVAMLWF